MKLEELENELRALAPAELGLTEQWKADILRNAVPRTPRLVLAIMASAWLCTLGFWLATPGQPSPAEVGKAELTQHSYFTLLAHHHEHLTLSESP
jgi:hypothetical protein